MLLISLLPEGNMIKRIKDAETSIVCGDLLSKDDPEKVTKPWCQQSP